jgi:hypothetical protein
MAHVAVQREPVIMSAQSRKEQRVKKVWLSVLSFACVLGVFCASVLPVAQAQLGQPTGSAPALTSSTPVGSLGRPSVTVKLPKPTPCDNLQLSSVQVVKNNRPTSSTASVQGFTYYATVSQSGNTWTANIPAEPFDVAGNPYLVRVNFRSDVAVLDAYHEALSVLTKAQVETLRYISSTTTTVFLPPCFIRMKAPNSRDVGSAPGNDARMRTFTHDYFADVTISQSYAVELWYFAADGTFTKKGDYVLKFAACTAASSDPKRCH